MWGVVPIKESKFLHPLKNPNEMRQDHLLFGMATCHSLTLIDGKLSGDPLDVKVINKV